MGKQVRQVGRETCFFCDSEGPLQRHHVYPEALGGSDSDGNLVDLCATCHNRLEQLHHDRLLDGLARTKPVNDETAGDSRFDRFDSAVNDSLNRGQTYRVQQLANQYRTAGVMDRKKIKERVKRLDEFGVLEEVGHGQWRFVGVET